MGKGEGAFEIGGLQNNPRSNFFQPLSQKEVLIFPVSSHPTAKETVPVYRE